MNRRANISLAWAVGGSLVALGLIGLRSLTDWSEFVDLGLALVATIVVLVALQQCLLWWRTVDEAAREAHKFAWYWGGSVGLGAAAGVATIFLHKPQVLQQLPLAADGSAMFAAGVFACVAFQTLGYAVAWAGWWLKRR